MKKINVAVKLLFLLFITVECSIISSEKYWELRNRFIEDEGKTALGGSLEFESGERVANDIIMALKKEEIDEAFSDPAKFLPSKNFMEARDEIEQSPIFKIIKKMPKGAVLHAHDTAIVSEEFVYNNITYRDNLFVCDINGTLSLKFFDKLSNDCAWQSLKKIRRNETEATAINLRIRRQLSMITDDPNSAYSNINAAWNKFISIFMFITPMLTYRPVYEDHFYQGLKELYEDNVLYLELRSTLPTLYELNGKKYSPIEVLRIYKEVATRFKADHPDFIGVKVIYAPLRVMKPGELDTFIKSVREMQTEFPSFFAGIDLVGQEDKGKPLKDYVNNLFPIINSIPTFFHAGETNWYGESTDENLIDAILLSTKRIGHGYALTKHPTLLQFVKQRNITVEICPISNQVLGLVKDLRNHPASILFADGFPVVISNDDPGLWGAKALSYDFYEAFMGMMSTKADIRALKQLALNSIEFSSMNEKKKTEARHIWKLKWSKFINEINNDNSSE